jgi:hypothetical protein
MYTNVNLAAPVGVLMFLATGAVVSILTLTLVFYLMSKKLILAKWVTAALLVVLGRILRRNARLLLRKQH